MPAAVAAPLILQDPGYLFWAPAGSTLPTMAALASTYAADAWPAAWIPLGATKDGSKWKYGVKVEPVFVAEFLDPIRYSTTERSGSLGFNLASFHLNNLKRVLNGGTLSTVSGAGVTLSSKYVPGAPGTEVRPMLGWESLDNTVRMIAYQCINGTDVEIEMAKSPSYAVMPCMFNFEVPTSGTPFEWYGAGVGRLGA